MPKDQLLRRRGSSQPVLRVGRVLGQRGPPGDDGRQQRATRGGDIIYNSVLANVQSQLIHLKWLWPPLVSQKILLYAVAFCLSVHLFVTTLLNSCNYMSTELFKHLSSERLRSG